MLETIVEKVGSLNLTWPMAKLTKLFGITHLVGKRSRSNFFFQGPLAE